MKTLFKLVIAILLLNAAVRGGLAMWQYYQFKDAAQQVVLFGQRSEPEEIQANIIAAPARWTCRCGSMTSK